MKSFLFTQLQRDTKCHTVSAQNCSQKFKNNPGNT